MGLPSQCLRACEKQHPGLKVASWQPSLGISGGRAVGERESGESNVPTVGYTSRRPVDCQPRLLEFRELAPVHRCAQNCLWASPLHPQPRAGPLATPGGLSPPPPAAVALPDCTCIRALHSLDTKNPFQCTEHFSTSRLLDSAPLWEGGLPRAVPASLSLHCWQQRLREVTCSVLS